MSLQGKHFRVTWLDQNLQEQSKTYDTHEQVHKELRLIRIDQEYLMNYA